MFLMFVLIIILGAAVSITGTRLRNIERKACKIEQAYDKIIEENEKVMRQNDQTLRILAEGGWQ